MATILPLHGPLSGANARYSRSVRGRTGLGPLTAVRPARRPYSPSRSLRSVCRRRSTLFGHDNRELAAVFVGGALGALASRPLSSAGRSDPARWPWATFIVNIVGAFLLGYFTTRLLERLPLSSYRRPLLGTGLCGGLTTFSTMQVETMKMIEHGTTGWRSATPWSASPRACWRCTSRRCWCAGSGCDVERPGVERRAWSSAGSVRWRGSWSTARWRAARRARSRSAR